VSLRAIPVVKNGIPVGLIERQYCMGGMAAPVHNELPGNEPCASNPDRRTSRDQLGWWVSREPLMVDKSTAIQELSVFLTEADSAHLITNFIITDQGRYIGLGDAQALLREITKLQIESARYADPLTLLPGNVPTNAHIEELLHQGKSFAVCHADIDDLNAFNDAYGYRRGDEAIQFAGRILGLACDPKLDFTGHLGGGDFIMVMQSNDWEKRCQRALTSFTQTSAVLTETEHRAIGGHLNASSQGNTARFSQPTLSMGIVWVTPEMFRSRHEIAAAAVIAKERAKNKPGNSLFIKRQRLHSHKACRTQHELMEVKYG
jgi:diguanylate cyclase (GGDEF)-like protein